MKEIFLDSNKLPEALYCSSSVFLTAELPMAVPDLNSLTGTLFSSSNRAFDSNFQPLIIPQILIKIVHEPTKFTHMCDVSEFRPKMSPIQK